MATPLQSVGLFRLSKHIVEFPVCVRRYQANYIPSVTSMISNYGICHQYHYNHHQSLLAIAVNNTPTARTSAFNITSPTATTSISTTATISMSVTAATPTCANDSITKVNHEVNRKLYRLNGEIKKQGRVSIIHLYGIIEQLISIKKVDEEQAKLLLHYCGSYMPQELPATRLRLGRTVWRLLQDFKTKLNIAHYNALLVIYVENEHEFCPQEFLRCMDDANVTPNRRTYPLLIARYCQMGDVRGALGLLEEMKEKRVTVNREVFRVLMLGHSRDGDLASAVDVLALIEEAALEVTVEDYAALAQAQADAGDIDGVKETMSLAAIRAKPLQAAHLMEVVVTLATRGHSQHVPEIISMLQPGGWGYNEVCKNTVYRLFNCPDGQGVAAARAVYATMTDNVAGVAGGLEGQNIGVYYVRHMVKRGMPLSSIVDMCLEIQDDSPHCLQRCLQAAFQFNISLVYPIMDALTTDVEVGVRPGEELQTGSATRTVMAATDEGHRNERLRGGTEETVPQITVASPMLSGLRTHYFWPLICIEARKNQSKGVFGVLQEMRRRAVTVTQQTLIDYALPRLLTSDADSTNVHKDNINNNSQNENTNSTSQSALLDISEYGILSGNDLHYSDFDDANVKKGDFKYVRSHSKNNYIKNLDSNSYDSSVDLFVENVTLERSRIVVATLTNDCGLQDGQVMTAVTTYALQRQWLHLAAELLRDKPLVMLSHSLSANLAATAVRAIIGNKYNSGGGTNITNNGGIDNGIDNTNDNGKTNVLASTNNNNNSNNIKSMNNDDMIKSGAVCYDTAEVLCHITSAPTESNPFRSSRHFRGTRRSRPHDWTPSHVHPLRRSLLCDEDDSDCGQVSSPAVVEEEAVGSGVTSVFLEDLAGRLRGRGVDKDIMTMLQAILNRGLPVSRSLQERFMSEFKAVDATHKATAQQTRNPHSKMQRKLTHNYFKT